MKAAIVGLSWIATDPTPPALDAALPEPMPVSHAGAYAALNGVELVAVCDVSDDALARFAERWGKTWPRLRAYREYERMLAAERPQIVSVCTPDDLHTPVVVAAAAAGVRGILCEKPLATNLADAERMLAAVERHGVALSVDVTRRWSPEWQQARALVRAGRIGRLRLIVAVRGGPKGWLYRAGGHLYDLVCFFADAEPAWVVGELDEGYEDFVAWRPGVPADPAAEPGGSTYVRFANGVRASVHCSPTLPDGYQVELFGTKGRLRIDDHAAELWTPGPEGLHLVMQRLPRRPHQATGILAALQELVRLVQSGGEGTSTGRDALRALRLILATVESHHRGGERIDVAALRP